MVSQSSFLNNFEIVADHTPIAVTWLPQYHDMGLIGYYLYSALKGGTTIGFSPIDFIQRPALWLETLSNYKATASSAPNFAYEYCLRPGKIPEETYKDLDLSSLVWLMNAAEPVNTRVHQQFLEKFSAYGLKADSFFSAYGLAEFTLAVSNYGKRIGYFNANALADNKVVEVGAIDRANDRANDRAKEVTPLLSCGVPLGDTEVRIVSLSGKPGEVPEGEVGEIWLHGKSSCKGYWNRPELSKEIFEAQLESAPGKNWIRTGDLGFTHDGEIFICGRSKDLIIIRGMNYYPQDIEKVVTRDPAIRKGCPAAFSIQENGKEKLVLLAEIRSSAELPDARNIQNQVLTHLGVSLDRLVYIPPRSIPKTSSGKIRRAECKKQYLGSGLQILLDLNLGEMQDTGDTGDYADKPEFGCPEGKAQKIPLPEGKFEFSLLFSHFGLTGTETQSLDEAGLDSIRIAELGDLLKRQLEYRGFQDLSDTVDLRLLQKIPVSELMDILYELDQARGKATFRFKRAFARIQQEYRKMEADMMKSDAQWMPDFPFPASGGATVDAGQIFWAFTKSSG